MNYFEANIRHRRGKWSGVKLFGTVAALALAAVSIADTGQLKPLPGSVLGTTQLGTKLGAVDGTQPVQFALVFKIKDAALQTFVDQVSNPVSPSYRHFLSPEEIGQQFGAAQADVDSATAFLKSNGLTVTMVSRSNTSVFVQGTAAQVQKALHTSLVSVQRDEDGSVFRTNETPVQLPAALADKVQMVYGLDTSRKMIRRTNTTTLIPTLYRPAYNGAVAYNGGYQGQHTNIAIANWDGFRLNNLPYMYSAYGLPTPSGGVGNNVHVIVVGGGVGYGSGSPQGEGDLDIQNVLQSAPLSNLYVYDDNTSDNGAPLSTYTKIANDNIADVVSESYGWATYVWNGRSHIGIYYGAASTADHNEHLVLSAQGITYMAASGDNGTSEFSHTTAGNQSVATYAYPDIDPEVMSVGGTVVTVDSVTGARQGEVPWGLAGGYGATGGFDIFDTAAHGFAFNTPGSYQTTYIHSLATAHPYRLVPDVASQAGGQDGLGSGGSFWAYIIYYNQGNANYPLGTRVVIDGTSCASPAIAGSLGVVEQRLFANTVPNANRSNVRLGRIQDYLYRKAASSASNYGAMFYDITGGSSVGVVPGTAVNCLPGLGWDFATGWGSLNFNGLYKSFLGGKP